MSLGHIKLNQPLNIINASPIPKVKSFPKEWIILSYRSQIECHHYHTKGHFASCSPNCTLTLNHKHIDQSWQEVYHVYPLDLIYSDLFDKDVDDVSPSYI